MKKTYLFLVLILTTILLFSCILTSKNPLGDYKTAKIDENILGKWKVIEEENKDAPGYMIVMRGEENHLIFILFDKHYNFDEGYQGFITEIDNEKYINLNTLNIKDGKNNINIDEKYIFLHYKIEKNKLIVSILTEDIFEEAIKKGEIKGEIKKSKKGIKTTDITLTDSSENIVNFIKGKDYKVFIDSESSFVFEKIKKIPSPVKK